MTAFTRNKSHPGGGGTEGKLTLEINADKSQPGGGGVGGHKTNFITLTVNCFFFTLLSEGLSCGAFAGGHKHISPARN